MQGHDGYPNDRVFLKEGSLNAIVWDPASRLMKDPDVHDLGTRKIEKIGDNQYKMALSRNQDYGIKPGDYITVSHHTLCVLPQAPRPCSDSNPTFRVHEKQCMLVPSLASQLDK